MDTPSPTLATLDAIKRLMTEKSITKHELAQVTGIPYSTLNRKLRGSRELSVCEIQRIADALSVLPKTFMPWLSRERVS